MMYIKKGSEFSILLTELSSAGLLWSVEESLHYEEVKKVYKIPEEVGSPTQLTYILRCLTNKPFTVKLIYQRPFEDEPVEVREVQFNGESR